MLSAYAQVLRTPGAIRFTSSGFVARMPIAITGLSIVLVVSTTTGSYGLAGATASGFAIAAAAGTIATSRLVDRHGQRRILRLLSLAQAACLIGFVIAVRTGSVPAMVVLAILSGLCVPSIGPAVRARWSRALEGSPPQSLRTAFALEGIWDELIFTIGPLIATTLALHIWLESPILLAAALVLTGTFLLSAQRATEPPPSQKPASGQRRSSAIRSPGMAIPTVIGVGLGSVFGAFEVSAVALTEREGQPGTAGVILALWALSSGLGGLWFGSRHVRMSVPTQAAVATAVLSLGLLPAVVVGSIPALAAAAILSGVAIAPALMLTFALAERLVAPQALTEGLTWVTSGINVGFSAGVAMAGLVVDSYGTSWSFALALASAILASILAFTTRSSISARMRPSDLAPIGGPSTVDLPVNLPVPDEIPGPGPGWQTPRDLP